MEALNLCLRAVAKSGDIIAIESPAFYGTLQIIESLGMQALEIPTDPRDGIVLDALASAIKRHKIKACLFVTNFSNPLGSCMPDRSKKELVELLARREIPLIEDDIYGDIYFGPLRPKTAKAYDKAGLVMLCSSFSKTLAPGYRVGWAVPGTVSTAGRESQVYQLDGDGHGASDGDRGIFAEWRLRSLLEKASPRIDDASAADEQRHQPVFSRWNQNHETPGRLRPLGRAAPRCRLA